MNEQRIHRIFKVSVLLKGAHPVIECIGGLALALASTTSIVGWVNSLTLDELIEDPNDFIAMHLLSIAQELSVDTKNFYALYLLSHGIVKLALVVELLRNKLWSYPASLIVLALFIAYQIYRFYYTQSVGLVVLTVFDVFVMVLIWHEYRLMRRHHSAPPRTAG
jgi:uncharacterized membrane protein